MYVSGEAISYKSNRSNHEHCSTTAPAEKNISKAQKNSEDSQKYASRAIDYAKLVE